MCSSDLPLIKDTTLQGATYALDGKLDDIRLLPRFMDLVRQYARGEMLVLDSDHGMDVDGTNTDMDAMERYLAWYLLRNAVPVSTLLTILRQLARDAHAQCLGVPPPEGTDNEEALDLGIKEVLHTTGTRMATNVGTGWSVRSLNEIIDAWKIV